jgi:hypothetical protein
MRATAQNNSCCPDFGYLYSPPVFQWAQPGKCPEKRKENDIHPFRYAHDETIRKSPFRLSRYSYPT